MVKMNKENKKLTTIPLFKSTREDLRKCKIYRRESWDDVLQRLIESYNEHKID